jgi:hypothetical protein
MLSLTWVWTSFSIMAGGGARGKAVGIARGTTTRVGRTIKEFRIFIIRCQQAGGIITGTVVGTDISGIISGFLSARCNRTGEPGKKTGIGRGIIPGVCNVPNISLNLEKSKSSIHRHNIRHHKSIRLIMESLEKAVEKSGIENSMAKYQSVQELSATVNRLASTATH